MRPLAFALLVGGCAATPPPVEPEWEPAPITPSPPETWAKIGEPPPEPAPPRSPPDESEKGTSHFVSSKDEEFPAVASAVDDAPEDSSIPAHVAWVRDNCTPQSFPVAECETRCSGRNCEAECEVFEAYASCPMVGCPDGTDPNWITEYYQATCRRQARERATDEELRDLGKARPSTGYLR